ncbi:hypothetical protein CSPHI_10385 [Corynebacterium sphenisci DSM 44792]|uniref:SF3 helicase domain-containing protein n=1 Tax=Corynebacterium sphenisci DSM 44792 TaxID=1437874 RepID=A0A1L7CZS6_9CORY|nr:phage/plasmid primase, P4 family [Corynebacterium sphenisci]APT91337.1 hypothetical protein CSPHI_10385 [Corynebacterium sphenisci DSM 44792]
MGVYRPSSTPPAALFAAADPTAAPATFHARTTMPYPRRVASVEATEAAVASAVAAALDGALVYDAGRGVALVWDGTVWQDRPDALTSGIAALTHRRYTDDGAAVGPHIEVYEPITAKSRAAEARDAALDAGEIEPADPDNPDCDRYVWADDHAPWRPLAQVPWMESQRRTAAAAALLETHPRIRRDRAAFDAAPGVVATAGGAYLHLATDPAAPVRVAAPDPALLVTRGAAAAYDPDALPGSRWARFVEETQPDPAMRDYLARLVGVAVQGAEKTDVLPVLVGDGANGKSVFVEAVAGALGGLAATLDPAVVAGDAREHMLVPLRGARWAVATETEGAWNAAALKRLTGGDQLTAAQKYERAVSWSPTHTLVVATNHRPRIPAGDGGFWRRYREISWPASFRDRSDPSWRPGDLPPDPHLAAELATPRERAAILAWAVGGWRDYVARGCRLDEPPVVVAATREAQADASPFAEFAHETFGLADHAAAEAEIPVAVAYALWQTWRARDTTLRRAAPNTSRTAGSMLARELRCGHVPSAGRQRASLTGIALTPAGRELLEAARDAVRWGHVEATPAAREWIAERTPPPAEAAPRPFPISR